MTLSLTHEAIENARIDPAFTDTPLVSAPGLDAVLGAAIRLKVESLTPIRSFKGRGADLAMAALGDAARNGVVAASAGNFGQGVAFAATKRGIRSTIFVASGANPVKIEAMRGFGAEVRIKGDDFDAAKAAATAFTQSEGGTFVEDGSFVPIAIGAGTIAREITRAGCKPDIVVVPLGNGSLLNGIGTWMRHAAPETEIVAVCAKGAPAMEISWRKDTVIETDGVDTIADGVAVRVPVPVALDDMKQTVDDVVLVDDDTTIAAMRLIHEKAGLVTEPAGALGVAAIMDNADRYAGKEVATILCGSNIGQEQMRKWLC